MPGAVSNGESSLSLKAGLLCSRALQAHAETPRGRLLLARPVGARGATLRGESRDPRGRHARTAAAPAREACLALGPSRNTKPFEPLTRLARAESPGTVDTGPKSKGVTCRTSFSLSSRRCKVAR